MAKAEKYGPAARQALDPAEESYLASQQSSKRFFVAFLIAKQPMA